MEPAWIQGITGKGVVVAFVDDGKTFSPFLSLSLSLSLLSLSLSLSHTHTHTHTHTQENSSVYTRIEGSIPRSYCQSVVQKALLDH